MNFSCSVTLPTGYLQVGWIIFHTFVNLHLLRLVLWSTTWFPLENVLCVLDKNMHSAGGECSVLSTSATSKWFIVLSHLFPCWSSASLFYPSLKVEYWHFQLFLLHCPFLKFCQFCLMCLGLFRGCMILLIIISFWWIDPLIKCSSLFIVLFGFEVYFVWYLCNHWSTLLVSVSVLYFCPLFYLQPPYTFEF